MGPQQRRAGGGRSVKTLPLSEIKIAGRHRKDLGDIDKLARSIRESGLLHPVVVTPDHKLVGGERRIAAFRKLGRTEIPVTVAHSITDAKALLIAERDENECREDPKPSEKATLGMALEELERPSAAARKAHGQTGPGKNAPENFTGALGNTGDIVGAAVGMSRPTYERAKLVVQAASGFTEQGQGKNKEVVPVSEEVRAAAVEAMEEMDRTNNILRAHDKVAPLVGKKPARGGTTRDGSGVRKDTDKPYEPVTDRQHSLANGQKSRLITALSGISGYCRGLEDLDLHMAFAVMTDDERSEWAKQAKAQGRQLRRLANTLTPKANV